MFHTGIVVDDLDKAMTSYTAALGLQWAEPIPSSGLLRTAAGLLPRLQWFTYSTEGAHRIELIEVIDGTAWAHASKSRLDHIGYWVDDLAAEKARLVALGFDSEISAERADGVPVMSYHLDPNNGLYIELVDRGQEPDLSEWWSGGSVTGVMLDRLKALGLDEHTVKEAFAMRRPHSHGPLEHGHRSERPPS